jgi:hypothetical protein
VANNTCVSYMHTYVCMYTTTLAGWLLLVYRKVSLVYIEQGRLRQEWNGWSAGGRLRVPRYLGTSVTRRTEMRKCLVVVVVVVAL